MNNKEESNQNLTENNVWLEKEISDHNHDHGQIENMLSSFESLLKTSKLEDNTDQYLNCGKPTLKEFIENHPDKWVIKMELPQDFRNLYNIDEIDVYELWKYLLYLLRNDNNEKILLFEISNYFIGILKGKDKLDLNERVDYWSFEKVQLELIFCFLVNFLDRISTLYEIQKRAWKEFPSLIGKEITNLEDLTPKELEFILKGPKEFNFAGYFLNNHFKKIDKGNFHKYYLSERRNQYTHHSSSLYSPIAATEVDRHLAMHKIENEDFAIEGHGKKYKEEIVYATLYLILVVREMDKDWSKWKKRRKKRRTISF